MSRDVNRRGNGTGRSKINTLTFNKQKSLKVHSQIDNTKNRRNKEQNVTEIKH